MRGRRRVASPVRVHTHKPDRVTLMHTAALAGIAPRTVVGHVNNRCQPGPRRDITLGPVIEAHLLSAGNAFPRIVVDLAMVAVRVLELVGPRVAAELNPERLQRCGLGFAGHTICQLRDATTCNCRPVCRSVRLSYCTSCKLLPSSQLFPSAQATGARTITPWPVGNAHIFVPSSAARAFRAVPCSSYPTCA